MGQQNQDDCDTTKSIKIAVSSRCHHTFTWVEIQQIYTPPKGRFPFPMTLVAPATDCASLKDSKASSTRYRRAAASVLALLTLLGSPVLAQTALSRQYKPAADRLITAALADNEGYARLAYLTDHIASKMSPCSP